MDQNLAKITLMNCLRAKISGVSVRTLNWYDEIGLLKPAYHGANSYRYYEEVQLANFIF